MRYLLVLVLLAIGAPAAAKFKPNRMSWSGFVDEEVAFIAYAVPESDAGLLWLYCDRATGVVTVVPSVFVENLKEGDSATIVLTSNRHSKTITGKAESDESGDMRVSGPIDPSDLARLLSHGSSLQIVIPGDRFHVPLNRRARTVFADFRARCPSLR